MPIRVSVAAGRVRVPLAVAEALRTVVPEVLPEITNLPTLPAAPKVFTPVMASVEARVITVELALGNVMVVPSVPANIRVLEAVRVFPSAIVRVALVAGAVIATLLIEVAVATPSAGVVSVGEVRVLLMSVSVVARPTKVSVASGNVRVLLSV